MQQWIYRLADGRFLAGGSCEMDYDRSTQGLLIVPDDQIPPDPARERYDAASETKRRPATQAERDEVAGERRQRLAELRSAESVVRCNIIWLLRRLQGRAPTPAEVDQATAEWSAIYANLPTSDVVAEQRRAAAPTSR